MPTVTGTIRNPDGTFAAGSVIFQLVGAGGRALAAGYLPGSNQTIEGVSSTELSGSGVYSIDVPSNDDIVPAGTRWSRTHNRSNSVLLYVTTTPSTQREEDILADAPGSIASAALTTHIADLALHGGGILLASALKNDADFTTTSTTGADVPGLSITFTVPTRTYAVVLIASGSVEDSGEWGALGIYDSTNTVIGAPTATAGFAAAGFLSSTNYITFGIVPNQMHAPTAGTSVTYKARAQTSVATSVFTVKTQLFGPASCAQLFAVRL